MMTMTDYQLVNLLAGKLSSMVSWEICRNCGVQCCACWYEIQTPRWSVGRNHI